MNLQKSASKLLQGITITKLTKEHNSNPVNPVLANPVYLTGYIEQMGTGTTDIIDHCLEYGLRKPEFHQDDDFRVVLWRPEVQERGKERGKEQYAGSDDAACGADNGMVLADCGHSRFSYWIILY